MVTLKPDYQHFGDSDQRAQAFAMLFGSGPRTLVIEPAELKLLLKLRMLERLTPLIPGDDDTIVEAALNLVNNGFEDLESALTAARVLEHQP